MFNRTLATNGLIAILRGLRPEEAESIGSALYAAGIRIIEVPLNSPQPLRSLEILRRTLPDDCLVGAGTVLSAEQVQAVKAAGGQLIVMPHCDVQVLRAAKDAGLYLAPGVATPSEAFAALTAGADALKVFPAEQVGIGAMKAWLAVLPPGTALLPVGGITPDNMAPYLRAGAAGFGLGSALYSPGLPADEVGRRAQAFIQARRAAMA
ncbi:2-dehydro-3-deoxy-6-phosphogalactonate aldolase [Stutzerimonas stutzeri]|uniref:2-dehydro-3-deoxy-6-phosphogalactonate aldolase n=1 Tax=Stutzerimonas stutzeri TaxID=316 RepID=UPI0031DA8BE1